MATLDQPIAGATSAPALALPPRRDGRAVEFLTGLAVLATLVGLLAFALVGSGRRGEDGYRLNARFSHIDGLNVGSDVRLAGVAIGQVVAEQVDPRTYQANVTFTVRNGIQLPTDSSAVVTSDSLLGGKYLALDPGGAEAILKPGSRIDLTQGSISLEQLLSKFIFSVTDAMAAQKSRPTGLNAPVPAPAPTSAPASAPAPSLPPASPQP